MSGTEFVIALVIAVGILGIIVPILPGSILILGAVIVWAWEIGTTTAWVIAAIAAAWLVVGAIVKYTIPGRNLKTAGVPNRTLWIGAALAAVGFFVVPVVGMFAGFVLGVYLGEYQRVGSAAAWPSTKAALKAVGVSILIELVAACLAVGTWVVGVVITPETEAAAPEPTSAPPADVSAPPATANAPIPSPPLITIALAGDIHFEGQLRPLLTDPAPLVAVTEPLAAADIAVANLETSVGTGGGPQPGKRYVFNAPPAAFTALAASGIDVASMANNHALDHGRGALPATLAAIEAATAAEPPLAVVGVGRDAADAFAPAILDVHGVRVAVVAASQSDADPTADPTAAGAATPNLPGTADAMNPARLLRSVRTADRDADVVVVYLHWGMQGERCPSASQRTLADQVLSAGADIVAGSHAHLLQGDGRHKDGYVAYGLGNYAWYTQSAPSTSTGVLTLTVRPPTSRTGRARVTTARWSPAVIGSDGLPHPTAVTADFRAQRDSLRSCAGLRH